MVTITAVMILDIASERPTLIASTCTDIISTAAAKVLLKAKEVNSFKMFFSVLLKTYLRLVT